MYTSTEEKELCQQIRETGKAKMKERLDRLSKVVGVSWKNDGNWANDIYCSTEDLRCAVYHWFQLQKEGRDAFKKQGVEIRGFDKNYSLETFTANLWMRDADGVERKIPVKGHSGCYGTGKMEEPDMQWWWKSPLSSTETMDLLAAALKYVDDLTDFCLRYKVAKGEVNNIEVDECKERVAKARHQLELLEKL